MGRLALALLMLRCAAWAQSRSLFSTRAFGGLTAPNPATARQRLHAGQRAGGAAERAARHAAGRGARPPSPWCRPGRPRSRSRRASARTPAPSPAGSTWRVYAAKADDKGNFRLVKEDKSPAPTLVLPAGHLHRACRLRPCHRGQAGDACAGRPCTRCSICRPAACGSKAGSATRAFRPGRFPSTSTKAASSSPATAGRSPSTS